jgi:hypothetical protein
MAALTLLERTSDGEGTARPLTGSCTVVATEASKFVGARVRILVSPTTDTSTEYGRIGYEFRGPGAIDIKFNGTGFIKAELLDADPLDTTVKLIVNQS